MHGRCIVLNSSYEFLHITPTWSDGVKLLIKQKATPIASYDFAARSERVEFQVPAVVVLKQYVRLGRRRPAFLYPSKRTILVRDDFLCAYCGKKLTMASGTKDHVHPRSRGGKDEITNVVSSCSGCNNFKDNRTPEEAGMKLLFQPRALTEEEKLKVLLKTHRAHEKNTWVKCLKEHGLSLF
jgi:5-methylcytosine-specific restriction endonuclease McrA